MQEKRLNTIRLNEPQKKVNEEYKEYGLVVKEVLLGNSLVESFKKVSMVL